MNSSDGLSQAHGFSVAASWHEATLLVRPRGDLDLASGDSLVEAVDSALAFRELSGSTVELDLGGLSFVDVCGYGALVEVRRVTQDRGVALVMRDAPAQLMRLVGLIGARGRIPASEIGH